MSNLSTFLDCVSINPIVLLFPVYLGSFTGLYRHTNVGIGLYYPSQFRVYFEGTRLALNVNGCCTYVRPIGFLAAVGLDQLFYK